jgi:hypothetical protein
MSQGGDQSIMTFRRGEQTFRRGVDRLFDQIDQFTIYNAMFAIGALWSSRALGQGLKDDHLFGIDSFVFPLSLGVPLAGVAEAAFAEQQAESRTLLIEAGLQASTMPDHAPFTRGFNSVLWLPITPVFVDFVERVKPWLRYTCGGVEHWPASVYFARVIRNAISHGGRLDMIRKPWRDAEWHHLKFGKSDHDTQAIGPGGFLSPADMLFLMIDASDELDRIGCPLL